MYRIDNMREEMRIRLNPKVSKFVSEAERKRKLKCEETIKRMDKQ
jgi:hypothetical protein